MRAKTIVPKIQTLGTASIEFLRDKKGENLSGQVSQSLNTAPGSFGVSSHPASGSIKMDKSPKVGREYEKPDFIALAPKAVMSF